MPQGGGVMADEETDECGRPCPPGDSCDDCTVYWEQMRERGYWKDGTGWTEKGWREMLKGAR